MTTTIRVDDALKNKSDRILQDLGLTMSGAVTIFLKQVVKTRSIPFPVQCDPIPNAVTREAIRACQRGAVTGPFTSGADLVKDALRA